MESTYQCRFYAQQSTIDKIETAIDVEDLRSTQDMGENTHSGSLSISSSAKRENRSGSSSSYGSLDTQIYQGEEYTEEEDSPPPFQIYDDDEEGDDSGEVYEDDQEPFNPAAYEETYPIEQSGTPFDQVTWKAQWADLQEWWDSETAQPEHMRNDGGGDDKDKLNRSHGLTLSAERAIIPASRQCHRLLTPKGDLDMRRLAIANWMVLRQQDGTAAG
ncbi:hypothetical protein ABEF95_002746 [Exophiala dermatitidis]